MNETLVRIRASSLPDLLDCPARWEAKHVRGLRLPKSAAAHLGTAIHAGTAVYDEARLDGQAISVDDAAGVTVDTLYHPEEDMAWGEDSPQTLESVALGLHRLYCANISPTMDYVAIEATCTELDIPELGISLTGTTDRVYRDQWGDLGIADLKTGKNAVAADGSVKTSGHAAQLGVYELLAGQTLGERIAAPAVIVGLQVAKTENGRRVGMGQVESASDMLVGNENQHGLLEIVSRLVRSGDMYGNPRSSLCSEKFCPAYATCRWRR